MKGLRSISIVVLVAVLLLGSVSTVFAGGPPYDPPGKLPKVEGKKRGFSGNVTSVVDGNVTILTEEGPVEVMLTDEARYKIPRVMNKWDTLTEFTKMLGEDLSTALFERRVVALAGNVTGTETWKALKFMLLPEPGLPPLHAHRTGNVTVFNPWIEDNVNLGNITIEDVDGVSHTFDIDGNTTYRPKELSGLTGDDLYNAVIGHVVTVVTTGDPKIEQPVAKAIVVHRWRQDT